MADILNTWRALNSRSTALAQEPRNRERGISESQDLRIRAAVGAAIIVENRADIRV